MEPEKDEEILQAFDERRLFDNYISKHTPSTEKWSSAAANHEPEIWEACAEDLVDLPKLDSMAALSVNQPEKDQEIISWKYLPWEEILQAVDDKRWFNNDMPKHTEDHENVERQDNTLDNNIQAVNLQADHEPEHVEQPPSMESLSSSSSANHYFPQGHDTSSMAAPSNNEREVNPEIWQACARSLADIPKKDTLVYYFPQGHMEHVQEEVLLHYPVRYGCCLCGVVNVSFLADPQTDQVFVKFLLVPISNPKPISIPNPNPNPISIPNPNPISIPNPNRILINPLTIPSDDFVSFIKVLTKTDVSTHLLVTTPLIKYIFSLTIPQTLLLIDIHGKIWEVMFESIKSRSSSFPALTSGWIDFVRAKNLRPGDSIVFMLQKSTLQYYIGIRRAIVNTRIGPEDVGDAIQKARDMKSFEVVYYPNLDLPEFVVPREKVNAALHVPWRREMPVMIVYDPAIARPRKWLHSGRLLNDIDRNNYMIDSPDYWWRVLQVQWDVIPDMLKKKAYLQKNMSPWELEI